MVFAVVVMCSSASGGEDGGRDSRSRPWAGSGDVYVRLRPCMDVSNLSPWLLELTTCQDFSPGLVGFAV